ncbi:MAG: hypothetical protein ACI92G_004056 [Candidatus Pelagisphaera sp.]|jgi:hypothetical protein
MVYQQIFSYYCDSITTELAWDLHMLFEFNRNPQLEQKNMAIIESITNILAAAHRVPDSGFTVVMLGASLTGLALFVRKIQSNKK